ncbi:ParB/RepB/Spo0J family partition protein [Variovorax sp. LjRoot290]|uniref:ParB/RepB/Spo0J family partition protein n=1 Tax=Variovorax sp. LjRoot290 TaxID=3342316 RepID=UPI003ECC2E4C
MATRKFLEKGNSIVLPSEQKREEHAPTGGTITGPSTVNGNPDQAPARPPRPPRTAIGGMAAFMREESLVVTELEALKVEHARFDGADPVRALDPQTIRRSRWANRHTSSFDTQDFADLRDEVRNAGGNIQPIKVRPVSPDSLTPEEVAAGTLYEIVYGHRRHAACLELGLPVNAVIQARTDRELFEDMERENRERADLSPYEQGAMYLHALKEGLYPSMRQMGEALGANISVVSRACALAGLPQAVVDAFPSPVEIQFRWAKPLSDAQQRDPDALLERARRLRGNGVKLTAAQVFNALVDTSREVQGSATDVEIAGPGGRAVISLDRKGRMTVKFDRQLTPHERTEFEGALRRMLGK